MLFETWLLSQLYFAWKFPTKKKFICMISLCGSASGNKSEFGSRRRKGIYRELKYQRLQTILCCGNFVELYIIFYTDSHSIHFLRLYAVLRYLWVSLYRIRVSSLYVFITTIKYGRFKKLIQRVLETYLSSLIFGYYSKTKIVVSGSMLFSIKIQLPRLYFWMKDYSGYI